MHHVNYFSTPLIYFFFNDTATTEIYTLSLHDALPISERRLSHLPIYQTAFSFHDAPYPPLDRKSTRLNSSHGYISYAVFCLKKKNKKFHVAQISTVHPKLNDPMITCRSQRLSQTY